MASMIAPDSTGPSVRIRRPREESAAMPGCTILSEAIPRGSNDLFARIGRLEPIARRQNDQRQATEISVVVQFESCCQPPFGLFPFFEQTDDFFD